MSRWLRWFRCYENRIFLHASAAGLPWLLWGLMLWLDPDPDPMFVIGSGLAATGLWLTAARLLRHRVGKSLLTVANLLGAMRESDYSLRGYHPNSGDALDQVFVELNLLAQLLQESRLEHYETYLLFQKVIQKIDSAVLTFDHQRRLTLLNPAACTLLGAEEETLLGQTAAALQVDDLLSHGSAAMMERAFAGVMGKWHIRATIFREHGKRHYLLVVDNLSKPLREEERQSWQNLVRVLSHELNNSLAPIASTVDTLNRLLAKETMPEDWREDLTRGLRLIGNRAEGLHRFMKGYTRLRRLPPPEPAPVEIAALVNRAVDLVSPGRVTVIPGGPKTLMVDGAQMEQVLINLLKNAVEATDLGENPKGMVTLSWSGDGDMAKLWIEDQGEGLPSGGNLFVPFFTTKPHGSGIGLVLCRHIVEAHGGSLSLENRPNGEGARATLTLGG